LLRQQARKQPLRYQQVVQTILKRHALSPASSALSTTARQHPSDLARQTGAILVAMPQVIINCARISDQCLNTTSQR
jgi:hypothetical protein